MRIGNTIFAFFKLPGAAKEYKYMNSTEIRTRLKRSNPEYIEILDEGKWLTSKEEMQRLLQVNLYSSKNWIKNFYDCDNFAFSLMGLMQNIAPRIAFGIVHVVEKPSDNKHSLNFFIDKDKKLWFVEPQTNRIFINPLLVPYLFII